MAYPGGKNGAGVYQTLINLIPPHDTYIETYLGGGAIMRSAVFQPGSKRSLLQTGMENSGAMEKKRNSFNIETWDKVYFTLTEEDSK